jgi:hypothetical protein
MAPPRWSRTPAAPRRPSPRTQFDVVLEARDQHYGLFAPAKETVSLSDYAMALHAASLVKDGGILQIGIGSFSDALAQEGPSGRRRAVGALGWRERSPEPFIDVDDMPMSRCRTDRQTVGVARHGGCGLR